MKGSFRAALVALREHIPSDAARSLSRAASRIAAPARSQGGFTYIAALVMVVVMAIGLSAAVQSWSMQMRREREVELLFRLDQYRNAIRKWYGYGPSGPPIPLPGVAPKASVPLTKIDDLLKDPNNSGAVRYLRKKYKDPITGKDFDLIKRADGGIIGVKSSSDLEPLKQGNFPDGFLAFEIGTDGKKKYNQWDFNALDNPKRVPGGGITGVTVGGSAGGTITGLPGMTDNPNAGRSGSGTSFSYSDGEAPAPGWGAPPSGSNVGVPGWGAPAAGSTVGVPGWGAPPAKPQGQPTQQPSR